MSKVTDGLNSRCDIANQVWEMIGQLYPEFFTVLHEAHRYARCPDFTERYEAGLVEWADQFHIRGTWVEEAGRQGFLLMSQRVPERSPAWFRHKEFPTVTLSIAIGEPNLAISPKDAGTTAREHIQAVKAA